MSHFQVVLPVVALLTGTLVGATISGKDRGVLPAIVGVFSYLILLEVAGALANVLVVLTANFDTLLRLLLVPLSAMFLYFSVFGPCFLIAGVSGMISSYCADRFGTTNHRVAFSPRLPLIQFAVGLFVAVTIYLWSTRAIFPSGL